MMLIVSFLAFVVAAAAATQHRFGTLVECTTDGGCLWMGRQNDLVDSRRILHEMLAMHHRGGGDGYHLAMRNLQGHIDYIEAVYTHANELDHAMSMHLGLNPRNLHEDPSMLGKPLDTVLVNIQAKGRDARRLASSATTTSVPATLNWCTADNPQKRTVCADVKSQSLCGSCWAFAATDLIETAVAIATKNAPISLSSQQLLSCSKTSEVRTYSYCFAGQPNIPTWLQPQMKWDSKNSGCQGGMTHIALTDAVTTIKNLASRIDWPYSDSNQAASNGAPVGPSSSSSSTAAPSSATNTTNLNVCGVVRPSEKTAAHIQGWQPALDDKSCSDTKDTVTLLKRALQQGPLAVALNAQNGFKNYASGVFKCASVSDPSMIDHAILLVGYGTSATDGDYWILKNSYGVDWGQSGFAWLGMDNQLNCGLNVFPILVTGASAGPAANITVDGGGSLAFAGMSMNSWVGVGGAIGVAALALTIVGVCVARKRMHEMHL
ncbi:Aste57867_304 [Aphanomyces stellatus]|uniref:Aste57867_304 protein n=1 Tax=Aphanomyces stellatus TaxID=120398 RepID=A0A485K293_9STRA|nr:hypothetical protein As57867_000304 [Aphanomyces stellatus]VFT77530.1 Aste57867_304 [Aphanomyces stellatus]